MRIDPKARPYGMHAFDLLAELLEGTEIVGAFSEHGQRLLASLGVTVREPCVTTGPVSESE